MANVRIQQSPMYGQPQTQGPVRNRTGQKQSRLEMLQANYQKKIMKEKEEKLIKIYEDNQKKAIDRVNSRHGSGTSVSSYGSSHSGYSNKGNGLGRGYRPNGQHVREADREKSVREYFTEQREGTVKNNNQINSHANGNVNGVNNPKPPFPTAAVQHRANPNRTHSNSAGRDKSRRLEPINHQKQPIDYNPDRYADIEDSPNPPIQMRPQLARPGKKAKVNNEGMNGRHTDFDAEQDEEVRASIPDHNQLKRLRKQHQQKQATQKAPAEKKLTDFQKWQMEQNTAKEKRLQDFRRKQHNPPAAFQSDSEDEENPVDDEIKRKERELLERIQQQQNELNRLKREREEEEERERNEQEKERKRQEAARRRKEALSRARRASEDEGDKMDSYRSNSYRKPPSRYEYEEIDEECPPPQKPPIRPQPKPTQQRPPKPSQSKQPSKKWVPPASDQEERPLPSQSTDNGVAFYAQAAEEAEKERLSLRPCPTCGRKFNADRLDKHRKACTASKKERKVFDMTKKRVEGTEAQKYIKSMKKTDAYYSKKVKKTDWRKQHEGFVQSIKYAKKMSDYEAQGGNILDLPPPPPSENPDYVKCPYCERKFNPSTAERHIPKCKDIKARPAPPKSKRR